MTAPDAFTSLAGPISASSQICARIAFLSAFASFLLFIALHVLKRELDPAWHMVSEYALGQHGWAMTFCFFFLSLSCAASVLSLLPMISTPGGKIGLLLLLCAAAGLAMASVFPTDPITVSPANASHSAGLHALSVLIGVPALTFAALLVSFAVVQQSPWKIAPAPLLGFAHLAWISLLLTVAVVAIGLSRNGGFGPTVLVGWPNRLMFLAYFGWLGSLTWPLAR